jgi:hypothetical protein
LEPVASLEELEEIEAFGGLSSKVTLLPRLLSPRAGVI